MSSLEIPEREYIDRPVGPGLSYLRKIVHADPERERDRRVEIYAGQWEQVEGVYGSLLDGQQGRPEQGPPTARPVMTDKGERFESAKAASRAMVEFGYSKCSPGAIRHLLKRGHRGYGRMWAYASESGRIILRSHRAIVHRNNKRLGYASFGAAVSALEIDPVKLRKMLLDPAGEWRYGRKVIKSSMQMPLFAAVAA